MIADVFHLGLTERRIEVPRWIKSQGLDTPYVTAPNDTGAGWAIFVQRIGQYEAANKEGVQEPQSLPHTHRSVPYNSKKKLR